MRRLFKLVGEVRDLQIVDRDDQNCGICDDLEFEGGPGGRLVIKALLVGPGALAPRLPRGLAAILRWVAGGKVTRIPWEDVESISGRIRLKKTADAYHLHAIDHRLARPMRKIPALS